MSLRAILGVYHGWLGDGAGTRVAGYKIGRYPLYDAVGTFAVSSMPKASITASVVFKVGLPLALNER